MGVRCVLLIKWAGQIIGCITTQRNSSRQYAVSPLIFLLLLPFNLILSMFFYCFISSWNKKKTLSSLEMFACQMPLCRPATTNKIMWNETSAVDIGVLYINDPRQLLRIIRNVHRLQDTHSLSCCLAPKLFAICYSAVVAGGVPSTPPLASGYAICYSQMLPVELQTERPSTSTQLPMMLSPHSPEGSSTPRRRAAVPSNDRLPRPAPSETWRRGQRRA